MLLQGRDELDLLAKVTRTLWQLPASPTIRSLTANVMHVCFLCIVDFDMCIHQWTRRAFVHWKRN